MNTSILNGQQMQTLTAERLAEFCCPRCGKGGFISASSESVIVDDELKCSNCGIVFPVIDGIPRLVELDNYSESFGYQWNIHSNTQLDSNSGLSISRDRLFAATGWGSRLLNGQRILEAGSGAGRFTEVLVDTKAKLYSFDFSRAVDANARNNGSADNLTLFQGDIFNIPFSDGYFDHVLCLGVIQHTPDPESAFFSLASKVKPGGKLYIDVYTRSWNHLLQWKYLLRPLTKRIDNKKLYAFIVRYTPKLIPLVRLLKQFFGRAGARLMPIVEYSHFGLEGELNKEWAVLDTFDMYSPEHDHPQSMESVRRWFVQAGFVDIHVWYGDNGVVGRGTKRDSI